MHTLTWLSPKGAALAFALVSIASPFRRAFAQEEPEALIRQGVEMRRHGDDAKAHGYFKRAYDIAHTPRAAAQLGLVEQALGHFIDAEQHLSEALDSGDAWVDQNRPVLEESRKAVRAELGSVELRGLRADTIVQIAGRAAVPAPGDGIIWVIPGKTTLRITAPKRETITKEAVLAAGGRIAIDVEIQPEQEQVSAENRKNGTALPAARPPPGNLNMLQSVSDHGGSNDGAHDRPVPPWKRWWFWTAAGAVVVGGAVTAVLLLRKDPGCRAGEVCSSL